MSGVVLGGVVEVMGSNLARGKIFIASIGSFDSLYPSIYIYLFVSCWADNYSKNIACILTIVILMLVW